MCEVSEIKKKCTPGCTHEFSWAWGWLAHWTSNKVQTIQWPSWGCQPRLAGEAWMLTVNIHTLQDHWGITCTIILWQVLEVLLHPTSLASPWWLLDAVGGVKAGHLSDLHGLHQPDTVNSITPSYRPGLSPPAASYCVLFPGGAEPPGGVMNDVLLLQLPPAPNPLKSPQKSGAWAKRRHTNYAFSATQAVPVWPEQ